MTNDWDSHKRIDSSRGVRFPFPNTFLNGIDEFMQEIFNEMACSNSNCQVKERRLPDGSTVKEFGPVVYGYSISSGPDGRPVIRDFGNVRPPIRPLEPQKPPLRPRVPFSLSTPQDEVEENQELLVDTLERDETVEVVAELLGVDRSDIQMKCDGGSLTINVDRGEQKYSRRVELPAEVDSNNIEASYKNGVLRVVLKRLGSKNDGVKVKWLE